MRTSYKKDVLGMMNWADELATTGKERQKLFIKYALHMFRQSLLSNYMGDVLLRISTEEEQFLKNFAPLFQEITFVNSLKHLMTLTITLIEMQMRAFFLHRCVFKPCVSSIKHNSFN